MNPQSYPPAGYSGKKAIYTVLSILYLIFSTEICRAQDGTEMYEAIYAGSFSSCGSNVFSESRNNLYYNGISYSDTYNGDNSNMGQYGPEVWYWFEVTATTDVTVSLCGSNFDTYIHILDDYGNEIMDNDDSNECGYQSHLKAEGLAPGYYYIVVEGYGGATGDFTVTISPPSGTPVVAGAKMSDAINAGVFSSNGSYSHMLSNDNPCLGNDIGEPSLDIYYKFTLNQMSKVRLSHCGSNIDTYMSLLGLTGQVLVWNDDAANSPCPGQQAYLEKVLPAGTYYVVSEGAGTNTGSIITNIQVEPISVNYPAIAATLSVGMPVSFTPTVNNAVAFDSQLTTTLAGTGFEGFANGPAGTAMFKWPINTVVDGSGTIYVTDVLNSMIRKISPEGVVNTLAGSGTPGYQNGPGSTAMFRYPAAVAVDAVGNVYVAEQQNHCIRKITPGGEVTTLAGNGSYGYADGTGNNARFSSCTGIAFGPDGNLYIADWGNNRIRKVTMDGVVTTYAGSGTAGSADGPALSATFYKPRNLSFDVSGNLYITDWGTQLIRRSSPSGLVSTLAGSSSGFANGTGTAAKFFAPCGIAVDASGTIYVADQGNNQIRKVMPDGTVSTLSGSTTSGFIDGTGNAARFYYPVGLSIDKNWTLYVADYKNNSIRKIFTSPFTVNPQLPTGLLLNPLTGAISGTPTSISPTASYTVSAYGKAVATLNFAVTDAPVSPSQNQNYIATYIPRKSTLLPKP